MVVLKYAKMGAKYATSKNYFFRLSAYNVLVGFSGMVKEAIFPEDPLSKEHWQNSFELITSLFALKWLISSPPVKTPGNGVGDDVIDDGKKVTESTSKTKAGVSKATGELNDIIKNGEKMSKHNEVKDKNNLPGKGEPNSSVDLLNPNGSVKQRRYYDENGRAKEDIDFNHPDDRTHTFPHRHIRDWSKQPPRQKSE